MCLLFLIYGCLCCSTQESVEPFRIEYEEEEVNIKFVLCRCLYAVVSEQESRPAAEPEPEVNF